MRRQLPVRQLAVRDAQHHLIVSYPGEHIELYDHRADPLERRDLASEDTPTVGRLRGELERWMQRTPEAQSTALEPERIEALRALGYIE